MNRNINFSDSENIDYSQYTKKTFSSKKIFLLIMAILATVSDLALLIVFAIGGHGGLAVPILLFIIDGLFIAGVCLSNFRFKYSIYIWVTYIVLSVFVTCFLAILDSGETYVTTTAKCLNVFAHLALYGVSIFASIYPILKSNKKIKLIMFVAVVIAVVLVGAFAVFFCSNGYFGQGFVGEYRVVGYTYEPESDTYIASSIKLGRSDKVVIPQEFNGKKVSGVNCSIFTYTSIKSVEIRSSEKIEFFDTQLLEHINEDLRIGVDKKYIDDYREAYLKVAPSYDNLCKITFANNMYPVNLDEGERYVTFEYQEFPKQTSIVPTWIGKKGEAFNFDYASDIDYLQHTDRRNSSDLLWCYQNGVDKKILSGQSIDLVGKGVNDNINNVSIDFEKVFRIYVEDDNDSKYEPSDEFKKSVIDGIIYNFRLVTLDSADSLLEEISREGFDLSWEYRITPYSYYSVLTDARELLAGYETDTAYISPRWTLKAPTDLQVTFDKANYVYGDDVNMKVSCVAPLKSCQMQYDWKWEGSVYGGGVGNGIFTGDERVIENVYPQSGMFNIFISVRSPETDLTASAEIYVAFNVGKRSLTLNWKDPEDKVFDNKEKSVAYDTKAGDLINDDKLVGNIRESEMSNTNAGSYTAKVELLGNIANKYEIVSGATHTYVIEKRPTQIEWNEEEFIYDGNPHNLTANAKDIYGYDLYLTYSGAQTNAGTHTAKVTISDGNYTPINGARQFVINQKSVTVNWSSATLIYSGYAQRPSVASIDGVVGNENIINELSYNGYSNNIDAGSGYTVSVTLPSSSNYKFDSPQTTEYNIEKKALTVRAVANNKIYDGRVNNFDFEPIGLVGADTKAKLGTPSYGGAGVNAVNAGTYNVSVSLPQNSVTKNYNISYTGATFMISKAQVSIKWSEYRVDNGIIIPPTASVDSFADQIELGGYIFYDASGREISSIPYANGTYSVEVRPTSNNVVCTNIRKTFTVTVENQEREVA